MFCTILLTDGGRVHDAGSFGPVHVDHGSAKISSYLIPIENIQEFNFKEAFCILQAVGEAWGRVSTGRPTPEDASVLLSRSRSYRPTIRS